MFSEPFFPFTKTQWWILTPLHLPHSWVFDSLNTMHIIDLNLQEEIQILKIHPNCSRHTMKLSHSFPRLNFVAFSDIVWGERHCTRFSIGWRFELKTPGHNLYRRQESGYWLAKKPQPRCRFWDSSHLPHPKDAATYLPNAFNLPPWNTLMQLWSAGTLYLGSQKCLCGSHSVVSLLYQPAGSVQPCRGSLAIVSIFGSGQVLFYF